MRRRSFELRIHLPLARRTTGRHLGKHGSVLSEVHRQINRELSQRYIRLWRTNKARPRWGWSGGSVITIKIERKSTEHYTETQQICVKETPTDKVKQKEYGNGSETLYEREYSPTAVNRSRDKTVTLLTQEIADEEAFNLADVIRAINGLK
jgi:hypothetical protein